MDTHERSNPARPAGEPVQLHRWVKLRMIGVSVVILALLAAVGYRAYDLQIRRAGHYRELARRQHVATVHVPAPRGAIYDARGAELAATARVDSVHVNPQEVHDLSGTAAALGRLLGMQPAEVEARLSSPHYFEWVRRHVRPEEARAVRDAHLEGVYLTPEPRRFYPGRELAGPVLGSVDIDGRGLEGIEFTMNGRLSGRPASATALRDASGALIVPDGPVAAEEGASVTLTIDRFIQQTAERALAAAIEKHGARAGVTVVLDIPTGNVLAMASWPTYDPNRPTGARDREARNRAVTDVYEIGSVMKVFVVAAALEAGVVAPDTVFDVRPIKVGKDPISDVHRDLSLTVGGIVKRSSNVGAVRIAQRLGPDGLRAAMVRFGFGHRTGIELPGEENGVLREARRWSPIELATISFGYGMSATPLQVAAAFAAVASGGTYRAPRILREVRDARGRVLAQPPVAERRVISPRVAEQMKPMLASVFDGGSQGGTAHNLALTGFRAAGKTGTAYKIDPATRRYGHHLYVSSFAGFAPLDQPRVLVLVLIDEPKGEEHFGAQVAGPPWLEVMAETLRYLGMPAGQTSVVAGASPADPPDPADQLPPSADPGAAPPSPGPERAAEAAPAAVSPSDDDAPPPDQEAPHTVDIPDLGGLGLAEALETLALRCAGVQVRGTGRVVEQVPLPGRLARPAECRLVLSPGAPAGAPSPRELQARATGDGSGVSRP